MMHRFSPCTGLCGLPCLLILIGAVFLLTVPASAGTVLPITLQTDPQHVLGEELYLSGENYESDTTYLFITGPNLPPEGGNLASPRVRVITGNTASFAVAPVSADHRWEYSLLTSPLGIADGIYIVYAVSRPASQKDLSEGTFNSTTVIIHKSVITAEVSPATVARGERFYVTGQSHDFPIVEEVQVWIIAKGFVRNATTPLLKDAKFSQKIDTKTSEDLPEGPCWLVVQHPKAHDLNIEVSGDWVRKRPYQGSDQNLFRITGPGSLQGEDAKDALVAAFDDPDVDDAYIIIPLVVNTTHITAFAVAEGAAGGHPASKAPAATGIMEPEVTVTTITQPVSSGGEPTTRPENLSPAPAATKSAMLPFAAIVAAMLGCGIVMRGRE